MTHKSESAGCLMLPEFLDQLEGQPCLVASQTPEGSRTPEVNGTSVAPYDRAIAMYEQLVQQGRCDLTSELARAHANRAIAVRELGETRAVAALIDQTIALYERLVEQEGRQELGPDLFALYESKASALAALGDMDRAQAYRHKAAIVAEKHIRRA